MARAFAREKWSKEFFENLKRCTLFYLNFSSPLFDLSYYTILELIKLTMNKWEQLTAV